MIVPLTVDSFRVAGLTLLPGDTIPAEFEALVPDSFKTQAPTPKTPAVSASSPSGSGL